MLSRYILSPGTKLVGLVYQCTRRSCRFGSLDTIPTCLPWLLGLCFIVGIVGVETIDWGCAHDILNALVSLLYIPVHSQLLRHRHMAIYQDCSSGLFHLVYFAPCHIQSPMCKSRLNSSSRGTDTKVIAD